MNKRSSLILAIISLVVLIVAIHFAEVFTTSEEQQQNESTPIATPSTETTSTPVDVQGNDEIKKNELSLKDIKDVHDRIHYLSASECYPGQEHYIPERDKNIEFNYDILPDRFQEVLKCLASCIYFEAGTEDRKHKLYVGSVVLNRYECKFRGKTTIESICLDKGQFSERMQTYKSPESWKEVSEESKLAAYELLTSGSILPHDVLYFDIDPKEHKVYEALKNNYTKYGEMTYFGY